MDRHLHITIHENGGRARGTGGGPAGAGGSGFEPSPHEAVVLPPTNPEGHGPVVLEPTNPEGHGPVVLEPTNPEEHGAVVLPPANPDRADAVTFHQGAGAATGACCCPCSPGRERPALPRRSGAGPGDYSGFVVVRLAPGVPRTMRSLWELTAGGAFPALCKVLELPKGTPEDSDCARDRSEGGGDWREPRAVLVSRPLIDLPPRSEREAPRDRCQTVEAILALEACARTTQYPPLHSLTSYFRIDLRPYPELLEEAVEAFRALPEVDLAYRELAARDPGLPGSRLADDQGYLGDAPVGIGAAAAWKYLGDPEPSAHPTVCDLEQGWHLSHAELAGEVGAPLYYGRNRGEEELAQAHHGTAVLGQLAAAGSGPYAVQGVARRAGRFMLASHYRSRDELDQDGGPHPFAGTPGHVAAAIVNALIEPNGGTEPRPLRAGDVLLLEVQRALLPTEVDAADCDAVRLATALQVVVIEAAGNGGVDLDRYLDPDTGRSLSRRAAGFVDSGAIVVGAARAALPHDRAAFSNHGSRLDCFAWGEAVTSCGYGDLGGSSEADYYTNTFSGTSSAAPIIAGAAALVQRLRRVNGLDPLRPQSMRTLLSDPATGTRQGPNVGGFVGVMPDLGAILRGRLQLVPDVYMRGWIGDRGVRPVPPDEPISSSPDVVPRAQAITEKAIERLTDPLAGANDPAPGGPVSQLQKTRIYVRLSNRGGVGGQVKVALFASPAATLITPEWWTRLGTIGPLKVPPGDRFVLGSPEVGYDPPVYGPLDAEGQPLAGAPGGVRCYSFLAVQQPGDAGPSVPGRVDRSDGLPPGPPWFDWMEYRAFLRGPGVAWRNVHRVAPAGPALGLAFFVAGTPDRARTFDLELLHRLPEGAAVRLRVPGAFASKLRQRQPTPAGGGGPVGPWEEIEVHPAPRFPLGRVDLAAGARIWSVLSLDLGPSPLAPGHSIAIRQLWRGEEVGRITWWIVA